jgi:hypothetical protein
MTMTKDGIDKPRKVVCNGCGQRITEHQASIHSGTSSGERVAYHYACCPWLDRPKAEAP